MRKSYRIKKEAEFQDVFDHGQSVANRNFVIYHLQRDQPHFRVGISVGKKKSRILLLVATGSNAMCAKAYWN